MDTPVKWVAELEHVREVSLVGTADLAFWKDRLQREDLIPAERDGKAQILVVAADMKYMGVRFREVSFSVNVCPPEKETGRVAAFLVAAFNSCRFFAFCERAFFSTPYYYGDVQVSSEVPCSIRLIKGGEMGFRAEMQAEASSPGREPLRSGPDGWDGPIFLPGKRPGKERKVFFGKLKGHTRTYPFLHGKDFVTIRPLQGSDILQALIDSHFAVEEWVVREDATHAKSKTYKRSEAFAALAHVQAGEPIHGLGRQ